MTTPPPSNGHHNYHPVCEAAFNTQISLELYASYVYDSIASYFNGHEVTLNHLAQFFQQRSNKEWEHAQRLMQLQNQRGGRLRLLNLSRPDLQRWDSSLGATEWALHLAISVNQSLHFLYHLAVLKEGAHLCDFLERQYLDEQMKFIKDLVGHITNMRKMQNPVAGLVDHLFEKLTLRDGDKKN